MPICTAKNAHFEPSKAIAGRLALSLASTSALLLLAACGGPDGADVPIGATTGSYSAQPESLQVDAPIGSNSAPSESALTPAIAGPGIYTFEYEGATGNILVPTPTTDPRLAEFESYRKLANGAPATYFVVEVDNMNGSENLNLYHAAITTDTGAQFDADNIGDLIDEWRNVFSTDTEEGRENYNIGVNLSNENMFYLRPGAKGTAVLAFSGELEGTPARVYVSPAGAMSEVEATKKEG